MGLEVVRFVDCDTLALGFFVFGLVGVSYSRNVIRVVISLELLLLGCNLEFLFSSLLVDDIVGEVFSVFILTVSACESVIGLGFVIYYFRIKNCITIDSSSFLIYGLDTFCTLSSLFFPF